MSKLDEISNTKPERMNAFFDARHSNYDNDMHRNVESFDSFYRTIAESVNKTQKRIKILDLGVGTGLELEPIIKRVPNAEIICVDISAKMMAMLKQKYEDKDIEMKTVNESYICYQFGENKFDYIISVMTMHHLQKNEKIQLYTKIVRALKVSGKYIEGDWVVSKNDEKEYMDKYLAKKKLFKLNDDDIYHIDIPFSLETQENIFKESGMDFNIVYKTQKISIYEGRRK